MIKEETKQEVVKKFVADWYEEHKENLEYEIMILCWRIKEFHAESDFERWLEKDDHSIQTLINMHQFGYTVEKEKLYRIKLNDHLYFKEFIDSTFPAFVIEDMPGALDEAFIGKKELALKHAREFGGIIEEAE